MASFLLVCLSLLLLISCPVSFGEETIKTLEIHTAGDLVTFSNNVNSGTNYSGTTVLLISDIYFDESTSNQFYPIGNTSNKYFSGTFDGQGYTINNLKITQGSDYGFGLFGYSNKGTLINVVLGSSCEVMCHDNNIVSVSGILGYCGSSDNTSCSVSNSVNMASVSFNGTNYGPPLHMGGIAGEAREIENCVNYGTISFSGSATAYIGGIVGYFSKNVITNCVNYGTIIHIGNSSTLYLGGITGQSSSKMITNCVNMGQITISGAVSTNSVGNIVGYLVSNIQVSNCYWNEDIKLNVTSSQGRKWIILNVSSFNINTLELNESVTAGEYTGKSLISALNGFVKTNNNFSLWISNTNEKSVSFFINNRTTPLLNTNKKLILLPDLLNNKFCGWFKDNDFTEPFDGETISDETITLYGNYGDSVQDCTISSSSSMVSSSSSSSEFPSEYVQITFSNKDLTKEEVIETIRGVTGNNDFEIIEFKEDESGDLKVIVKFKDAEGAQNFVDTIHNNENEKIKQMIKTVNFIPSKAMSFSVPVSFSFFILFYFM